jgi:putative aldouronate transport system permease protein
MNNINTYCGQNKQDTFLTYFKRNFGLYFLLLPGLIYGILFKILPMLGLYIAFVDYDIFAGSSPLSAIFISRFIGLKNFVKVFSHSEFINAIKNTFIISFMKIIVLFPMPIILALIINSVRNIFFKRSIQSVVYLPHFFSWVVVAGIFLDVLGNKGLLNTFLKNIGAIDEPLSFLTNKDIFRWVLVFTDGWKSIGWGTIVYLAALAGVDQEQYESAHIDGARKWQLLVYITLPGILSTIMLMLILRVGAIMDAGFSQIFAMSNPMVLSVSDIIQTYVYRIGLGKMDFSLGTAVGLFNSIVGCILVLSSNLLSRKATGRGIW